MYEGIIWMRSSHTAGMTRLRDWNTQLVFGWSHPQKHRLPSLLLVMFSSGTSCHCSTITQNFMHWWMYMLVSAPGRLVESSHKCFFFFFIYADPTVFFSVRKEVPIMQFPHDLQRALGQCTAKCETARMSISSSTVRGHGSRGNGLNDTSWSRTSWIVKSEALWQY